MLVFVVGFILGFILGCIIVLPDVFRKFKNGRKLSEIGQGRKSFESPLVIPEESDREIDKAVENNYFEN